MARNRAVLAVARYQEHLPATVIFAAGLTLRMLAQAAYHPALLYIDTPKYLYDAWPGADPLGYKAILGGILLAGDLGTVALIQHLTGLAIAAAMYLLLVRRGLPGWLAGLACAPVLLDGYQIQIEQTIMPDVWFEAFAVTGLVLLAWRPSPRLRVVAAAGLVLGAAALIRQVGEILVLPAAVYLLAEGRHGLARAAVRLTALGAAFAAPVLGYCAVSLAATGHFWVSDVSGITGRIAAAADCATLSLPAAERPLCPHPGEQAHGADWLATDRRSPLRQFAVPAGLTRKAVIADFDARVERQQPLRIAASVLRDSVRVFAVTKAGLADATPIARWQFQTTYPAYPPAVSVRPGGQIVVGIRTEATRPFLARGLDPGFGGRAQVDRPIAAFLRGYQVHGGYTPGPLLAASALAGLAGSLLALARRPRADQAALTCLLFLSAAGSVLLVSDVFEFSWRYQLPALVTLPPAGALGAWALARAVRARSGRTDWERELADPDRCPGGGDRSGSRVPAVRLLARHQPRPVRPGRQRLGRRLRRGRGGPGGRGRVPQPAGT